MEPILIILSLLTISIITLVFVVVWRDRRDLKLRQITGEIEKVEELLKEMDQYKKEIKEMLATAKKQTDQAVSRVDNQVKQVRDSVVKLEQHVHSGSKDSRDSSSICSPCFASKTASAIFEVSRRTALMASSLPGIT